jgi:PAS domain S-box-containing protein
MAASTESKQKNIFRLLLFPFIAFVILIAITIYAWDFTNKSIQEQRQTKFDNDTDILDSSMDTRFSVYETVLYDIKALFAASNSVERNEFITYLQTSNFKERFPGISGISFAQYVKAADKDAFVQNVKQDTSLVSTGYPFFRIKPPGDRSEYYVSTYTLSATSSAVANVSAGFGLDLLSIPGRADAIRKAVDADMPVASTVITLLENPPDQKGFAIYLPVYKNRVPASNIEQRRNAILGVISGTFNASNLFGTILTENKIPNIAMAVYDTQKTSVLSSSNLLYNSDPKFKQNSSLDLNKITRFSLGERNWTTRFTALPGYKLSATEELLPWYVLIGGVLFSFLFSVVLYLLINSRARALSLAERMTRELAQSEEQYRTIFDSLQDVYYRTDKDGKIIFISPSIENYIGLNQVEVVGRNAASFYFNTAERDKLLQALQKTGSVTDYSLTLKGKDERPFFVSLTGHILFDTQKNQIGLEGVLRDVTQRRKDEKELLDNKARDEAILTNIGDGVIVSDQNGKLIVFNKMAENILGMGSQEVDPQKWSKVYGMFYPDRKTTIPVEDLPLSRALKGESVENAEMFVRNEKIPVGVILSCNATPVKDVKGNILGGVVVFRDITKEKEVDRMKSEFISLASHQLRTPLSAMKWFLEMLLSGDAGELVPEQKEMVINIDESNERMIDLVNSLLNVSRIESGRIIIEPSPTDIKELLVGVQKEIQIKLNEKKQTLLISVHDDLPKINLDAKLIRQVYMNLLTNAIKYSPEKEEILIFVSKKDDLLISQVSDNGYGIPEKDKDRVFEKFYRGENIVKKVTDGNGLGLYLVKTIIESSGGKIWFESYTPEDKNRPTGKQGTTFWFSLPMSGMIAKKGEVILDS